MAREEEVRLRNDAWSFVVDSFHARGGTSIHYLRADLSPDCCDLG